MKITKKNLARVIREALSVNSGVDLYNLPYNFPRDEELFYDDPMVQSAAADTSVTLLPNPRNGFSVQGTMQQLRDFDESLDNMIGPGAWKEEEFMKYVWPAATKV